VSSYPKLLVDASPSLCLSCHDPVLMGDLSLPTHDDLERDCLECHLGHGGADRYFIRPEWAATQPAPPASAEEVTQP
jgi:hypothetical protein